MAKDYSQFTDFYVVAKDTAVLREYPEPDALALVTLKKGQLLRRLDTVNWNGAWMFLYADVVGGRKYEGYLHFEEVSQNDGPLEPPRQAPASPPSPPVATPVPPPATPQPPPAPAAGGMITLGCVDPDISEGQCAAYMDAVQKTTGLRADRAAAGQDMIIISRAPSGGGLMSVSEMQLALKEIGFFPGGETDGIFGYRTRSAVRLFQEYVRAIDQHNLPANQRLVPDGRYGPKTQEHLKRWIASGAKPDWRPRQGEYEAWLQLLGAVKEKYTATPGPILSLVNAFPGRTDSLKVADWVTTGPDHIHLIGIRREEFRTRDGKTHSDDIFVLLMKGLVFKFQGSTDPGKQGASAGAAFLTPGQHLYRFGWHKKDPAIKRGSQLALNPKGAGVLVIRSKGDLKLDDADIAGGLTANNTINIHWGGRGLDGLVNGWSEGCQVITGSLYIDPSDQLRDCTHYAAPTPDHLPDELEGTNIKTRGAYNVLVDLVTALSGDMANPGLVHYTLLQDADLDAIPALRQVTGEARARVLQFMGKPA